MKKPAHELPPVDMFVTTADADLEPPIITVNTVLSLLAVDYPANKLACYVSDDGCSPLTFFALIEASKFAKIWVPFCKKHNIPVRAPFRYFNGEPLSSSKDSSLEFQQEWKKIKDEYELLCQKIEEATQRSEPWDFTGEFAAFSHVERRNHPTIIKVILENKEDLPNGLPHLVYISREKLPKHPHHFKAGAMNVLIRVSGVMTNAPFMLNVDCDMYANNPKIVLHAMCMLLGVKNEMDSGFVQYPQCFYDGLKDDPFGNQFVVLLKYMVSGIAGIQGPFYSGTGCFHRRKVIYGLSPNRTVTNGELGDENLQKTFGKSMKFSKSAAQVISGYNVINPENRGGISSSIEAAYQVASCGYEHGTSWGEKIGLIYGSATEDVLTGLTIHGRGWKSTYLTPDPPAFLGSAPSSGPTTLIQQKRWSTGLLEIVLSPKSPILFLSKGKLHFRQFLGYMWLLVWGLRSIPELCYATLPAYCILTNSHFLPKVMTNHNPLVLLSRATHAMYALLFSILYMQVQEPAILIPFVLFIIYNIYSASEYLRADLSIWAWWNNHKMWRIISMTSWLFGFLSVILKLLGLFETMFEVTKKDQTIGADDTNANAGRFTFDESPVFVPGTAILLVNLAALALMLLRFRLTTRGGDGSGVGEIICSVWVVLCFWSFFKGLFGRGKYGIPLSVIYKSGTLALLFVQFCKWTSMG
ncbi:unnamed protein product [Ilex paraguariensis]|uniref:Cellulose synthase-like protein H1 n=1 Tax=Ilex paraguariensis TaxID=185542 RepID=A0ABC8SLA8_9AQUA